MPDYREFLAAPRFQRVIAISADAATIAYSTDTTGQFNLWTQPASGGPPTQLTSFTDQAVRDITWSPDSSRLAFTAGTGGDEQTQVYLVDAAGGPVTRLSGTDGRVFTLAEKTPFDQSGRYLLCGGNDRDPTVPDLVVYDLEDGSITRTEGLASGHVFPVAISPDARQLLAGLITSNTDCQCCLAETTGTAGPEVVTGHLSGGYFYPGPFAGDDGFFTLTTADGDRVTLTRYSLTDRTLTTIDAPGWDVEAVTVSADSRTVVWTVNQDGRSILRGYRDGEPLDLPTVPDGVIEAMDISADGAMLAMMIDTPGRPLQPAIAFLRTGGPLRYLTRSQAPGTAGSIAGDP
jgi:dipeptidyl aminopeptidase/acylaminoacyl peptidase